jgi:hypothetical protein
MSERANLNRDEQLIILSEENDELREINKDIPVVLKSLI